jgi:hypothetical protein
VTNQFGREKKTKACLAEKDLGVTGTGAESCAEFYCIEPV